MEEKTGKRCFSQTNKKKTTTKKPSFDNYKERDLNVLEC